MKVILTIVIVIVLAAAVFGGTVLVSELKNSQQNSYSGQSREGSGSNEPSKPIEYGIADENDYRNLEEVLLDSSMVKDLPNDGILLLSFYNFYTGEREWEKSYTIMKNFVSEGTPIEYDIKLIMHSKYLTILNIYGFCNTIKLAKSNGDFGTETAISTTSLLWKYRGMTKYKDCLGI